MGRGESAFAPLLHKLRLCAEVQLYPFFNLGARKGLCGQRHVPVGEVRKVDNDDDDDDDDDYNNENNNNNKLSSSRKLKIDPLIQD